MTLRYDNMFCLHFNLISTVRVTLNLYRQILCVSDKDWKNKIANNNLAELFNHKAVELQIFPKAISNSFIQNKVYMHLSGKIFKDKETVNFLKI